jgi:TP901 family phage tail tape measure protein
MGGMASTMRSMRGMLLGLGLPLAIGALTKSFLDFEKKMAHVRAVADDFGRSATGMRALTDAALSVGQAYGFTAVEVAEAQEALLKAGRSTAQVLGGELNAALTLAAAGTISLDEAATTTAVTMTIFKDEFARTGAGATEVANQLVGAANETVSGVQEMGTALSYVGPVAASLGVSFRETVATISVFNQAGIEADRAGTNLRGMLTNLLSPSAMARAEMVRLGIELTNSEGKFIGLAATAQELHDEMMSLGEAERAEAVGRLTTNASMPGFIVLMQGGAAVVERMTEQIRKSATAEEVAAEKLDSVTGAMNKFGAATSSAAIKVGGELAPTLESVANGLTSVATGFGNLGGVGQLALVALAAQLLMARRLTTAFGGVSTSMGAVRTAQERLNRMQIGATNPGNKAGMNMGRGYLPAGSFGPLTQEQARLQGIVTSAGNVNRALGQMGGSIATASSGWAKFGQAAIGGARVAQSAMRGLIGFMGGAPGLIFAGAMIGIAAWQAEVQRTERMNENLRSGIQLLGLEYARTGQVSMDSVRELYKSNEDMAFIVTHTAQLGVSIKDMAEAAGGNKAAIDKVAEGLDAYHDRIVTLRDDLKAWAYESGRGAFASKDITDSGLLDRLRKEGVAVKSAGWSLAGYDNQASATMDRLDAIAKKSKGAADKFREQHKVELDLIAAEKELAKTMLEHELTKLGYSAEEASEGLRALAGNLAIISSQDAAFNDRIKAMAENIDMLTRSFYSAASAQAAFYGAIQGGLGEAFNEDIPAALGGTGAGGGGGGAGAPPTYGTTRSWDEDVDEKGKRTRRDITTTRRPDGTTTVATTTTAPDGKKTTESRTTFDAQDTRVAAGKGKPTTRKVAPKLDEVTGQFDVGDPTGAKQHGAITKVAEATASSAQETFASISMWAEKSGMSIQDAMVYAGGIATSEFMSMRSKTEAELARLTGSAATAKRIMDAYFPTAKEFARQIGAEGSEGVIQALDALHIKIRTLPGGKIALVSDSKKEADRLEALGGKIEKLPSGKFKVTFTNAKAANDAILKLTEGRRVKVAAEVERDKLATVTKILKKAAADKQVRMEALAIKEQADQDLNNAARNRLSIITVKVVPYDKTAPRPGLDYFGMPLPGYKPTYGPAVPERWGGFHPAATGSLRDAMIAGPGTRYQWAEPETGGEAFVPRHGKHDRSMGILSKAAAWYGAKVTPASTGPAWGGAKLQPAGGGQVNITVRGEGVLSGMIEATVDGRLVKVAQTVANRRVR